MSQPTTRRTLQPTAGESLLLCHVATDVPLRFVEFATNTALADDAIYSSPLLSIPIPRYVEVPEGQQRWRGLSPDTMWHPLFWLPPRVADRYEIRDAHGVTQLEDDDTWALRVALELTASGLYDSRDGTWLDILHLAGIEIGTDDGRSQVRAWLDGAANPALDAIDMGEWFESNEERDWAIGLAIWLLPTVRAASASVISGSLRDIVLQGLDDLPVLRRLVCRLATSLLPDDAGELPDSGYSRHSTILKLDEIASRFEPWLAQLTTIASRDGGSRIGLMYAGGPEPLPTPALPQPCAADPNRRIVESNAPEGPVGRPGALLGPPAGVGYTPNWKAPSKEPRRFPKSPDRPNWPPSSRSLAQTQLLGEVRHDEL